MHGLEQRGPGLHGTREGDRVRPRADLMVSILRMSRENENGCVDWTGFSQHGYGLVNVAKRLMPGGQEICIYKKAHRVLWELVEGPLPHGMCLDHLCRRKGCISLLHLEVVTLAENTRRAENQNVGKTHCVNGHEFTPLNTYNFTARNGNKHRSCVICRNAAAHAHKERKRIAALTASTQEQS